MKAFYKVSVLGCLLVALVASTATVSFAQDERNKLYEEVTNNYAYATSFDENDVSSMEEALPKVKLAISAGEAFKAKFNNADNAEIIKWIDGQLPSWKAAVSKMEKRIPQIKKEKEEAAIRNKRFTDFDQSYKSKNWGQLFKVGDEIVANYDEYALDVTLQLAKTAFDAVLYDKQDAYVPQAKKYSTMALSMLKSGKGSKTGNFGVFQTFKAAPKYPDGKSNALGNMNFQIGWLKFYKEKNRSEALPYLYETSKYKSSKQGSDITYSAIGSYYVTSVQDLIKKQNDLLAQRNTEADKEKPDVERVKMLDYQIDMVIAEMKGYADRAIDSYLRGYGTLSDEVKNSAFGKNMFNRIKSLYAVRHPGKAELQTPEKINMDLAAVNSKSMPDPSSTVKPIDAPLKPAPKTESTDENSGETRSRTVSSNDN